MLWFCPSWSVIMVRVLKCLYSANFSRLHAFSFAANVSSGILSITTADAQRRLLDPHRVTVGNASDLAAEVRCSSSNYSENTSRVSWLYENGTAVSSGLQAFGTTQGDGILRIYPATVYISGGSGTKFWCLDTKNNESLRVTLVLRKSPKYIKFYTPATSSDLVHGWMYA